MRVGKKTFWTWVFHHADSACFVIRPSRGKAVVREFLGNVRPAVWISDRLGAQMGWATRDHQVCLAHLLRDIQYAIDAGDAAFAPGISICGVVRNRVTREAGLALPGWVMAPSGFHRWCEYGPRRWRCSQAAARG